MWSEEPERRCPRLDYWFVEPAAARWHEARVKPRVRGSVDLVEHPRPTVPGQLEVFLEAQDEAVLRGARGCVRVEWRTEGDPFRYAEGRVLERIVGRARA